MTAAVPTPPEESFDLPDFTPKPPTPEDQKGFRLYGHQFLCRPRLSFSVVRKFTKALTDTDTKKAAAEEGMGELDRLVNTLDWFFRKAIKRKEDYAKWVEMRDDEELEVDIEVLMKIASYLAEAYAGARPTGESSDSGHKTSSSAAGSRGGAPSAPLTYTRSETPPLVTAS